MMSTSWSHSRGVNEAAIDPGFCSAGSDGSLMGMGQFSSADRRIRPFDGLPEPAASPDRARSNKDAGTWSTRLAERRIVISFEVDDPGPWATPGTAGPAADGFRLNGGAGVALRASTGALLRTGDGLRGALRGGATLGRANRFRVDGVTIRSGRAGKRLTVDAADGAPGALDRAAPDGPAPGAFAASPFDAATPAPDDAPSAAAKNWSEPAVRAPVVLPA